MKEGCPWVHYRVYEQFTGTPQAHDSISRPTCADLQQVTSYLYRADTGGGGSNRSGKSLRQVKPHSVTVLVARQDFPRHVYVATSPRLYPAVEGEILSSHCDCGQAMKNVISPELMELC